MLTEIDTPATEDVASFEQRVTGLEDMGLQVCSAIENLAETVVSLQQQISSARAGSPADPGAAAQLAALGARLRQLEQQTQYQTMCADLSRTSRFHAKRATVVFVGTTYFGCNAKYGWLGFRQAAEDAGVESWFLPQTAEHEAVVRGLGGRCFPVNAADWTAEHLSTALSAAVVVTCDHLLNPNPFAGALLAGARHVQLWHGISIKEIGLGNLRPLRDLNPHATGVWATCGPFKHFIGTSSGLESEFRRWFGLERYAAIGYPRNDVLLREPTEADLQGVDGVSLEQARAARQAGRRVVLYAPTFRDAERGVWVLAAGLERLAKEASRMGDALLVAMHPVEAAFIPQLQAVAPSARFVAPRTDLYPLLREVDVLVTDYSSIMFDYLLLDRPVVLYRPDHQDYVRRSRQLFEEKLLSVKPGPVLTDLKQLLKVLGRKGADGEAHAGGRARLREQLFDHVDGSASARLNELLLTELQPEIALQRPTGA